mmetsp:Transcript_5501/g.12552  ORF Transcript_5501/g.12552 Transcript_5501/m.12552 type:complete len:1076 (+) Transcript_5501:178-3405(+)|eukprot:CAMPEP_0172298142 /NCGR_PEP_ID=MMETSP1058-20130122/921_1 /TAXON_ID=83371 /ORGANISM="Detonula confervacea, Strain CCMP 353" /LENGTH=1075 /DNA_ID=CAMNT_0013007385 /DNA_START=97 /DNA_END=3324 /DNA_ORIENTATION=-
MASSNRDAADATDHGITAASSGTAWDEELEYLPSSMPGTVPSSIANVRERAFGNTEQDIETDQKSVNSHMDIEADDGDSDAKAGGYNTALHSSIDSMPIAYPSDGQLDKNSKALSKEIDELFEDFDNFGPREEGEDDESNPFTNISNLTKDPGKDVDPYPSALDLGTQMEEHAAKFTTAGVTMPTQDKDNNSKCNAKENANISVNETVSLQPTITAKPIIPAHHRNSSNSRRRQWPTRQMESISETGNTIANVPSEETKDGFEDSHDFIEDFFVQDNTSFEQNRLINIDNDNGNLTQRPEDGHEAIASSPSSFSTPNSRRRRRASGESTGSASGNSSSTGSGRGSMGSGARLRRGRRHVERSNISAAAGNGEDNTDDEDTGRRRRANSSGNSLVTSLDAGMATLRRWIRARRSSFGSGAGTGAGSSSGHSVSSMTTMRLGEEDIFALSHTGSDPRRVTTNASSTSSDPNMNIFESNGSNGFLYYRPFEVHVHHDVDADSGIYGSDDESGTRSILLHPLVPSIESSSLDEGGSQQSRQRANSEPDRARMVDFFSSVYGSRAIDGGRTQDEIVAIGRNRGGTMRQIPGRRSSLRPAVTTSPIIIEEETNATDQDNEPRFGDETSNIVELTGQQLLPPLSADVHPLASALEESDATIPPPSPLSGNSDELPLGGELEPGNDANDTPNTNTPNTSDPNREARTRWIRINRRFRFLITSVAVLFSLLLFCVMIAWVLLTSTYVLSHNKPCDVPLKPYYWLITIQLVLDVFRADIMKWLCQWRTDSQRRVPPRIIMYNVGYLIYAMLVLRLGVRSVFISESTCSSTAPEFFYVSLVFVCLSLFAWATILLGYLIPFCFVAVLLTRNGYFPNGDIASSRGVMGGRRARIGTGRISGIVGEVFPNTYSNPAPPGCVEKLRVVLLHEFLDSYQRECCICMMEYKDGEVIVATPCDHVFHKRCCQEWFQLSRTCPVCRTDVPEALGMNDGTGATAEEQDSHVGSLSGSEEMRGGNNESRGNITVRREENQHEMPNFIRFMRRERRQPDHATSSHPEGIAVIELPDTTEGDGSQSNHPGQMQQLDV